MILFVSGRCDIPAFYMPWFMRRLQEGYVDVRNPFDPHQISRILLRKDQIDAILFCTKNPLPLLPHIDEIPFPSLYHVTLTPYHEDIEPALPLKSEILQGIQALSTRVGKQRVLWRYDPILLSERYTTAYHTRAFAAMCEKLAEYVDRVIISFIDMYKNTRAHKQMMKLCELQEKDVHTLAHAFGAIGKQYHLQIQTCAEAYDLRAYGIMQGHCIDRAELEALCGYALHGKAQGVRKNCGCMESADIGDYNCCAHRCRYCYANFDEGAIAQRIRLHDPQSSLLLGHIGPKDHIHIRREASLRQLQLW